MSSAVLSARNAIVCTQCCRGVCQWRWNIGYVCKVSLCRYISVFACTLVDCCTLLCAWRLQFKSRTLCQNIDIGLVCNVACRLENFWVSCGNVVKTNPENSKFTLKRGVSAEVDVSFGRNGQPLRPKCDCISAEILRSYQLYKALAACF